MYRVEDLLPPQSDYEAEMARRRAISRARCPLGEQWLPSIRQCVPMGGYPIKNNDLSADIPGISEPDAGNSGNVGKILKKSPNTAIKQEIMARKAANMEDMM